METKLSSHKQDYIVWLPNMLGLGAACAQLGLFYKFGIHDSSKKDDPHTKTAAVEEKSCREIQSETAKKGQITQEALDKQKKE